MTSSTFILILLLLVFLFFLYLFKLFRDDLHSLRDSLSSTKDTINTSLSSNTRDINDRLSRAAEVIGELKKEAGAFTEVSRSIQSLQSYLQSPKLRGNIGEMVLADLISQIFPASSYQLQYAFKSGEKVDVAITTDAGILSIDSKFPLENYAKLTTASTTGEQIEARRAFFRDLKNHLTSISRKYILPAENTLDFALMYIPSESVFSEVVAYTEIMEFARQARVYPVSPNTLYAALQTILLSFEGKKIESRAKEVFQLLRGIQQDFAKTQTEFATLGSHLARAHSKYTDVDARLGTISRSLDSARTLSPTTTKEIKS